MGKHKITPHILNADGTKHPVEPENGINFKLEQLRSIVGGHIEVCQTNVPNMIMVIDEEGKLKEKPFNAFATLLYKYGEHDPIVGTALICKSNQIH